VGDKGDSAAGTAPAWRWRTGVVGD
jgi:hypothetical protein